MNITIHKRKRALWLHFAGPEVKKIFDTLPDNGDDNDYDTAVERLKAYFLATDKHEMIKFTSQIYDPGGSILNILKLLQPQSKELQ